MYPQGSLPWFINSRDDSNAFDKKSWSFCLLKTYLRKHYYYYYHHFWLSVLNRMQRSKTHLIQFILFGCNEIRQSHATRIIFHSVHDSMKEKRHFRYDNRSQSWQLYRSVVIFDVFIVHQPTHGKQKHVVQKSFRGLE